MSKALIHDLGRSISYGRLSLIAKVLWTMLLTTADDQGRGSVDPDVLKWHVCPNVPELTPENIPSAIDEMVRQEMLHLYHDGRHNLYQVIRWWEYQQLQWARPSRYAPPAGWTDRVRIQRGRKHTSQNWDAAGGFSHREPPADPTGETIGEPPALPACQPPVDPPGQKAGKAPDNPPGDPPEEAAGGTNRTRSKQANSTQKELDKAKYVAPVGATRAGPATPGHPEHICGSTTAAPPRTVRKKPSEPSPPAVQAFRRASHRYPPKSWNGDIDQAVGREEPDLAFWEKLVKEWVGLGWNPTNVKGMLECYHDRRLPGRRPTRTESPDDPIQAAINVIETKGWT